MGTMSQHRAAHSNGPGRAGTLGLAAGGCMLMLGITAVVVLAVVIATAVLGPHLGTTVGCAIAVLLQLGAVGLAALRSDSPGGTMIRHWCWTFGIPFFTVCAPVGVTLLWIPDRETATSIGFGVGLGLVVLGWLVLRVIPTWRRASRAAEAVESRTRDTAEESSDGT